ncbi:hypothetical protein RRG08_009603 [Elysia crispata]|uniref:Cyclic nucleotide-binding domain-containing protein n=1 Tax=Elysia crispata TaxID=231223 RepID=A0AAE1CLQ4_9GAST|nr:hypothetical protein RRG08_009603 [Elysia crispata]
MASDNGLFIQCLKKLPNMRTDKDLKVIYSFLHGMEALSGLREHALQSLCNIVRYEFHEANDIIYYQGEVASCWYILLSGSVFIEGSMFLPRSSSAVEVLVPSLSHREKGESEGRYR